MRYAYEKGPGTPHVIPSAVDVSVHALAGVLILYSPFSLSAPMGLPVAFV